MNVVSWALLQATEREAEGHRTKENEHGTRRAYGLIRS